jgi:cobyrinic acid a,c-diamide synthase
MKEVITHQMVADKLASYLQHALSLANLVAWAESAMMEGEFEDAYHDVRRDAVARLGLADVRAFGLNWEDCETILKQLGYDARIEIVAV